jgi:hypothetical protein
MRRIALAVSALAVLVVAAHPVAAFAAAPSAPPTSAALPQLPKDAISVSIARVSTPGLGVTLDAGATESHDLVISNHTADLRLTVKLSATDANGSIGIGPGSWLSFGDEVVDLDPHAAVTVPMTIAVPHDTQPASALAHVIATVESAVAAADGSARGGTMKVTFPVSITVRGTPTAQIAIVDVHRNDEGDHHQLAIAMRNYGNVGTAITGHIRVSGDKPQNLTFNATLPPTQDTTVNVPWNATDEKSPTDVDVSISYGQGDTASWSSTLGAQPLQLDGSGDGSGAQSNSTPTSAELSDGSTDSNNASDASATSTSSSAVASSAPWWKGYVPIGIFGALLIAGAWFVLEMRRSKRGGNEMVLPHPYLMAPPNWQPGPNDATVELAKQLVALTDVIVRLATSTEPDTVGTPARARSPGDSMRGESPGPEHSDAEARAAPPPSDGDPPVTARAPNEEPEPEPEEHATSIFTRSRSASSTPGDAPRPDSDTDDARPESAPDPAAAALARLRALDRDRRRLHQWMDAEDAAFAEWPEIDAVQSREDDST